MGKGEVAAMAPDRRQRLLSTAAAEFAAAGYQQASLNHIIRTCGMSKSSFYYYVDSKQHLFDVVVEQLGQALVRDVDVPTPEELAEGDFWDNAARLLDRLAVLSVREPTFTDLGRMFYLPGAPGERDSAVGRAMEAVGTWLERTLAAGRALGAVRADLPPALQAELTVAVVRAFDEWSLRHAAEFDTETGKDLVRAQLNALKGLLAP